jgi:sn-glycerol 3-phosphate transport system ATP-binding protein
MAEVRLNGVRKVYAGGVEAVKGVSFTVPDKTFCVLVGPSGCGKSTLLRLVAGLETITSGDVMIGDDRVNDKDPSDRDIAMVFQNYALYPHMSVYENMAYGLKNRGTSKADIDKRVKEAAKILAIEGFLDRKPRQLSGGQRQRVAMGRAIVRQPKAFLFDEPLSNLDAKLRVQMRVEIRKLQRNLGVTSLYVTHDQLEAMTLGDMLVVMNGGMIEQIGSPLEVYADPASTFVATFIGSPPMNVFPVSVDGAGVMSLADGTRVGATSDQKGDLLLGLRPENLTIDDLPGAAFVATGRVTLMEPLGAETLAYITLGTAGPEIIVRLQGHATQPPGTPVTVRAAASALHRFDAKTGRRV